MTGLSPRVRGNRDDLDGAEVVDGSIPARAGEPRRTSSGHPLRRVYPRACGGTLVGALIGQTIEGLSPRVRGNRLPVAGVGLDPRSIPARAGEPSQPSLVGLFKRVYPRACGGTRGPRRASGRSKVYPRACGGTTRINADAAEVAGLSPRVRGNLVQPLDHAQISGSIPARAGEPSRTSGAT